MADRALSRDRRLTKAIARFARGEGFRGIANTSRFDHAFDCWALFDDAVFASVEEWPIAEDDPDLVEAARRSRSRPGSER